MRDFKKIKQAYNNNYCYCDQKNKNKTTTRTDIYC